MTIRIVFENCNAGMAANVGGSVHQTASVFEFESPEIEAHLKEWADTYCHTNVVGIEILKGKGNG